MTTPPTPQWLITRSDRERYEEVGANGEELLFAFSSEDGAHRFCGLIRNQRGGLWLAYNDGIIDYLHAELRGVPPKKLVAIDATEIEAPSNQVIQLDALIEAMEKGQAKIECDEHRREWYVEVVYPKELIPEHQYRNSADSVTALPWIGHGKRVDVPRSDGTNREETFGFRTRKDAQEAAEDIAKRFSKWTDTCRGKPYKVSVLAANVRTVLWCKKDTFGSVDSGTHLD